MIEINRTSTQNWHTLYEYLFVAHLHNRGENNNNNNNNASN